MKKLTTLSILFISLAFIAPIQASAATNAGVKPGSFFYFLDTTFENVGLFFTFNPEKKAQKALEHADERLAEIEAIVEEKNPDAVKTALANYESNIALATEKSKEVKDKGQAETLLTSIADNSSRNQEVLTAVLIKVPEEAKEAITQAIEASRKGQEEATQKITELKIEVERLKQEVVELETRYARPTINTSALEKPAYTPVAERSGFWDMPKTPEKQGLLARAEGGDKTPQTQTVSNEQKILKSEPSTKKDSASRVTFNTERAKELVKLLEVDRDSFYLLENARDTNAKQSRDSAEIIMDSFIKEMEKINNENQKYAFDINKDILVLKKKNLLTRIENTYTSAWLVPKGSFTQLIIDDLKKCIETNNVPQCTYTLKFAESYRVSSVEEIKSTYKKINEANDLALASVKEAMEASSNVLQNAIKYINDRQASHLRSEQIVNQTISTMQSLSASTKAHTDAEIAKIKQQEKDLSEKITCLNSIEKIILVPGKGWISVRQCSNGTYTESNNHTVDTSKMTPEQICGMRRAYSQSAYTGERADCSDLGL